MSENKYESLSSIVDDQQNDDKVLEEILNDSHLSTTWQRYHLMGNVMRGETTDNIDINLATSIAEAIRNETTILAPQMAQSTVNKVKAKIIPLLKPFGQVAIAASAAGLMILGVQQNTADTQQFIPVNQVAKTTPLGGIAQPVSLNFRQTSQQDERQAMIEQQRRFQALLSDHHQQLKISSLAKNLETDKLSSNESEQPE